MVVDRRHQRREGEIKKVIRSCCDYKKPHHPPILQLGSEVRMCRHGLSTCVWKAAACARACGWSGSSAEAPGSVPEKTKERKCTCCCRGPPPGGVPRGCGLRSAMAESSRGKLYLKLHQRQDGAGAPPRGPPVSEVLPVSIIHLQ